MRNKLIFLAVLQISLILVYYFSFNYFVGLNNDYLNPVQNEESEFITFAREMILGFLGKGLVSAQSEGLWTCLNGNDGSLCQEYPASECNEQCSEDCFPGRRDDFFECRLGTCVDLEKGTCSPNSPRAACLDSGGNWDERAASEIPECRPGCCLFSGQAQYTNENSCNYIVSTLGVEGEFVNVESELQCLILADTQVEGACVLQETSPGSGVSECEFLTQAECSGRGGDFNENILCSNPELNTVCQPQVGTSCIEGKDQVYWVDSCGNRENVYDSNKVRSYNNGRVLSPADSCSLESGNNPLGNQNNCGNCDYISGSICGEVGSEDEQPIHGDFVCKNLSCVDSNGNERKNGESWCGFDSQIGVQGQSGTNSERSVDLPGSGHYRYSCLDGEVRIDECSAYRNEVCVESVNEQADFSSAACRLNRWQQCLDSNSDENDLDECEENSACFLKGIRVDQFSFDVCTPKHAPGFDLDASQGGEVAEQVCGVASQDCTQIWVKGFTGWKCEVNCGCDDPAAAEAMNNLCMSLGDCGASVNIEGDFTDDGFGGLRVANFRPNYVSDLRDLINPVDGQKVDPLTNDEIEAIFGVNPADPDFDSGISTALAGIGAGAAGIGLAIGYLGGLQVSSIGLATFANSIFAAGGGAVAGFLVSQLLGLQGDAALGVTVAGIVGSVVTYIFFETAFTSIFLGGLVAAIIIGLLFSFLGIGDTEERVVSFECRPWQPPKGGSSCAECGSDGLPCNEYKCNSLGQSCEFINEGTAEQACVNVAPEDGVPPAISPNEEVLSNGFQYSQVSSNGFKIEGGAEDGCIPAFTPLTYGVMLNERGQCKVDSVHTNNFDDMSDFFAGSNLYKINHTTQLILPSLDSLGGFGVNPDSRADYNLYLRCSDFNGNANSQEYNIQFCVSPETDVTPPIISRFNPESPGVAGYQADFIDVGFFLNEPAECRWDFDDKSYSEMVNQIDCADTVEEISLFGWACNAQFDIQEDDETYYIRCEDQPWLEGLSVEELDGRSRNSNSQSVIYEVERSESVLEIIDVSPNGTILSAGTPTSVTLEVTTSGGAQGRNRFCEFNFGNSFTRFFESGGNEHSQELNLYVEKDYSIPIRCEDEAGNTAEDVIEFSLEVDNQGPAITRIYANSGLTLITNEPAECAYSLNSCTFNFNNGTLMSGSNLIHTTSFEDDLIYNIKCKDDFGNVGACVSVGEGFV